MDLFHFQECLCISICPHSFSLCATFGLCIDVFSVRYRCFYSTIEVYGGSPLYNALLGFRYVVFYIFEYLLYCGHIIHMSTFVQVGYYVFSVVFIVVFASLTAVPEKKSDFAILHMSSFSWRFDLMLNVTAHCQMSFPNPLCI